MARLDKMYPLKTAKDWSTPADLDRFKAERDEHTRVLDELQKFSDSLPAGEIEGFLMMFPVADGHAIYRVTKEDPFTVQWVPVHDAWQVSRETIHILDKYIALEQQRQRIALHKLIASQHH